jgi:hypothetical protein
LHQTFCPFGPKAVLLGSIAEKEQNICFTSTSEKKAVEIVRDAISGGRFFRKIPLGLERKELLFGPFSTTPPLQIPT